jgi:RNA polymerase sigma-70 factor (ECF subfamily)
MCADFARPVVQHEFSALTEPYRYELQVHCYRMLGSVLDAEDLVQETLLRAWRRFDTYQGRASLRAWLYGIATHACLDALATRSRRTLPYAAGPPADPHQPPPPPAAEPRWLDPWPTNPTVAAESSPEAHVVQRESIALAFLVALQMLTPRQRATLILRDVLDWPVGEIAQLLDTTISGVNSALHRARATLRQGDQHAGGDAVSLAAADDATRRWLERYMQAWEASDGTALSALLRDDVVLSMPPTPAWYRGHSAVLTIITAMAFADVAPGRWRLLPTEANAQPACAFYHADQAGGAYQAFGLQVLTFREGLVGDIVAFLDPSLPERFGLPRELRGYTV